MNNKHEIPEREKKVYVHNKLMFEGYISGIISVSRKILMRYLKLLRKLT